jgi:hypothetical protein
MRKSRSLYGEQFDFDGHFVVEFFRVGRLKRQRLGKLHRHPANIGADFVHPADFAVTDKIGHIERVRAGVFWHAEPGRNFVARPGAPVGKATERRSAARYVNHLSLGQFVCKILREPNRPIIPKSRLGPALLSCEHFTLLELLSVGVFFSKLFMVYRLLKKSSAFTGVLLTCRKQEKSSEKISMRRRKRQRPKGIGLAIFSDF